MTARRAAAWRTTPLLRAVRRRTRRLRARSRLRDANLRRTGAALRRARPRPASAALGRIGGVETTYRAPRTLLFVTVKRDNPTWRDLYGHWWVESGEESYAWWPRAVPVGLRQLLTGTDGVLNGVGLLGRSGTWQQDAQHGRGAAHAFHPVLVEAISDEQVLTRMREYAHGYQGRWRWAWRPGPVALGVAAPGRARHLPLVPGRAAACGRPHRG